MPTRSVRVDASPITPPTLRFTHDYLTEKSWVFRIFTDLNGSFTIYSKLE